MSTAAVALAASGIVALATMPASAGTGGKIVCTAMSGSIASTNITISGCSGTAVPGTGGSSTTLSISLLASGGPVTWINSQVTTFGTPTEGPTSAKHCPGYVKGAATEPTAVKFKGAVTADTAGLKLPGKYQGVVCIGTDANGTFSAEKPLKIS